MIKAGQSQVAMAASEKENSELKTKQEVIRLYQDFKLSQKVLAIATKSKLFLQVNNSMAEKDFVNGQLPIDRLSLVLESFNKSLVEYEICLNRFETSYMQLETYTGVNLSALLMHLK
jgi:outer membrane protein TolC